MGYEWFALAAALCWAVGSLFAEKPAREIGGYRFSVARMSLIALLFCLITSFVGDWSSIGPHMGVLVVSSVIGIVFGDVCLFASMSRLGPRRSGILWALNAPITCALAIGWLGVSYTNLAWWGSVLVVTGVAVAIWFGRRRGVFNASEHTRGAVAVGVLLGLGAAWGHSVGAILVKPVVDAGAEVWAVAAWRVSVSALCLNAWALARGEVGQIYRSINAQQWAHIGASGVIGMLMGVTLLTMSFRGGDVGLASVLSSTTPVVLLPLLWVLHRQRPAAMAWVGAVLCVLGSALIIYA